MELSILILRVLYLIVLYVLVYSVLISTTVLRGNALILMSFFIAVLVLYVSFNAVYEFIRNNELVFQFKLKKDDGESDENENGENGEDGETDADDNEGEEGSTGTNAGSGRMRTNISTTNNVSDKEYIQNHAHKFLQDVFFN